MKIKRLLERKWFIAVIIFGWLFIFLGISQFKFPISMFVAYKATSMNVHIYRGATKYLEKLNKAVAEKSEKFDEDKINALHQELNLVKQEMSNYKEEYVDTKAFPLHTKILILVSILSAMLYMYTGALILKRQSSFKPYLVLSIIFGLLVILLFYWEIFSTMSLVVHLVNKLNLLASKINPDSPLPTYSDLYIAKNLFAHRMQAYVFIGQILFIAVIIYFFTRPKVKEQFK